MAFEGLICVDKGCYGLLSLCMATERKQMISLLPIVSEIVINCLYPSLENSTTGNAIIYS
jgi:hypothetical protein